MNSANKIGLLVAWLFSITVVYRVSTVGATIMLLMTAGGAVMAWQRFGPR